MVKEFEQINLECINQFEDSRPKWLEGVAGTLSNRDILRLILSGDVKVDPLPDFKNELDTCKLDLHLGGEFTRFDYTKLAAIDTKKGIPPEALIHEKVEEGQQIVIPPTELIIAKTREYISLPNYLIGRLEGKSSVARLGIIVEAAPIFDAGWNGYPVMEIINCGRVPVILYEGMRICAFNFQTLTSPAISTGSKYQNQVGPLPSKIHEEFKKI